MWRSCALSTIIPDTRSPSAAIAASPGRQSSLRSNKPSLIRAFPPRCSQTTAWSSPPGFAGGQAGRNTINGFQAELRRLGVVQKHSKPNHPTTCGKVERFHQTLKKWLKAQPRQPQTVAELQALCNTFIAYYNNSRPHRSLSRRTPAAAYQAQPKATPSASAPAQPQPRVRRDVVDSGGTLTLRHNGRLHHIGVGRTHARTPILMLINGLDIRIIHATTGEIIRELTLNPAIDYQPRGKPKPS